MKTKVTIALIIAGAALAATVAILRPPGQPASSEPEPADTTLSSIPPDPPPPPVIPESVSALRPIPVTESEPPVPPEPAEQPAASTNKLERLTKIRESFRALATGDPTLALRAAKQITDETERETALLTLVTEWTHGELNPPRRRAKLIDLYGLEAGLGFELAKDPVLALLWANEMTEGQGRVDLLQHTARGIVGYDPAAAFEVSQQVPEENRHKFFDALFATWGGKDTEAAMRWADQLPDPVERAAALEAIRTEAPVGIGVALRMQDGYPVMYELVPGTPAELSGQIRAGDRIVALAQGRQLIHRRAQRRPGRNGENGSRRARHLAPTPNPARGRAAKLRAENRLNHSGPNQIQAVMPIVNRI